MYTKATNFIETANETKIGEDKTQNKAQIKDLDRPWYLSTTRVLVLMAEIHPSRGKYFQVL